MCFYLQFYYWLFRTAFVISIFFHRPISFIVTWITNSNYNFISNNVKVIKASEKHLKLFEYLKNNNNNGFVFLQETHSPLKTNKNGKTILRVLYFFHMEKLILVVCQSATREQKLLKLLTQHVTKMDENFQCRIKWHKLFANQLLQF